MAKPILNYKGVMLPDPSDPTHVRKVCVPTLVDRNQTVDLEGAVAQAIDRGLIAGLKSSAAKSIADGIMLQLGELLNNGTGVIFGDFFVSFLACDSRLRLLWRFRGVYRRLFKFSCFDSAF